MKNPVAPFSARFRSKILSCLPLGSALLLVFLGVILAAVLQTRSAEAASLGGHLRNKGPATDLELTLADGSGTYRVQGRPALIAILRALKDGNFISATGTVYPPVK